MDDRNARLELLLRATAEAGSVAGGLSLAQAAWDFVQAGGQVMPPPSPPLRLHDLRELPAEHAPEPVAEPKSGTAPDLAPAGRKVDYRSRLSAENEATVRSMHAAGASGIEIAAAIGIDRKTVVRWRKQLGLWGEAGPRCGQASALTPETAERFRALVTAGATLTAISRELGAARATVHRWRAELGLQPQEKVKPGRQSGLTAEMEARIRALGAEGRTRREIAEIVGVAKGTAIRWCIALKLDPAVRRPAAPKPKPREWSEEDDQRFAELWQAGHTVAYIALMLGKTEWKVSRRLRVLGLPRRQPVRKPGGPDEVTVARLRHLVEEGLTRREIAVRLGAHEVTVSRWCRAFGLVLRRRAGQLPGPEPMGRPRAKPVVKATPAPKPASVARPASAPAGAPPAPKPAPRQAPKPAAAISDAEQIQAWLRERGGPRRFEAGTTEMLVRETLEKRGVTIEYSFDRKKQRHWKLGEKRYAWDDLVAHADQHRIAAGLPPIGGSADPRARP